MTQISVIVPVYNVEKYIKESIKSITRQTFSDIEIIIVDDGSTDRSSAIIDGLSTEDHRIKVVHQNNEGLSGARNAGLKIANGEYIGFIDSDDIIEPNMYELLVESIRSNNSELAVCNFYRFDKKQFLPSTRYRNNTIRISEDNVCDYYKYAIDSSCNKLYKAEVIKSNDLWFAHKSIVPQEDFYFLIKYLSRIESISSIKEPLYGYRIRKSSITKSKQPENFNEGCLRLVKLTRDFHLRNNIDRNIKPFELYLLVEMMKAVINNSHSKNSCELKSIIEYFAQNDMFEEAVFFNLKYLKKQEKSVKNIYDILNLYLYSINFFNIASFLEYIRIKRLDRKQLVGQYFE